MSYQTVIKDIPVTRCTFAYAGTYGHECGSPAVSVAVFTGITDSTTCGQWQDGIYFAGRCARCATIRGGENAGGKIEPLAGHVNKLVTYQWVPEVSA